MHEPPATSDQSRRRFLTTASAAGATAIALAGFAGTTSANSVDIVERRGNKLFVHVNRAWERVEAEVTIEGEPATTRVETTDGNGLIITVLPETLLTVGDTVTVSVTEVTPDGTEVSGSDTETLQ